MDCRRRSRFLALRVLIPVLGPYLLMARPKSDHFNKQLIGKAKAKAKEKAKPKDKRSWIEKETGMTPDQLREHQQQMREQFYASQARRARAQAPPS